MQNFAVLIFIKGLFILMMCDAGYLQRWYLNRSFNFEIKSFIWSKITQYMSSQRNE